MFMPKSPFLANRRTLVRKENGIHAGLLKWFAGELLVLIRNTYGGPYIRSTDFYAWI
jgi:hypothetical protein